MSVAKAFSKFASLFLYLFPVFSIIQVDGKSGWKMNNLNEPENQEEKYPQTQELEFWSAFIPQMWHQRAQQM